MNLGNIGVVRGLIGKIDELNESLTKYIPLAFPIGTVVCWDHGNHTRSGTVDMHSRWRSQEVRVELQTGSTKWIGITQLHSYSADEDRPNPAQGEQKP